MLGSMLNLAVLFLVVLLAGFAVTFALRHRRSLAPRRGIGVAADLGALADQPRVLVQTVAKAGLDRIRLVLAPAMGAADTSALPTSSALDLVVALRDGEFGFELLQEWMQSATPLAIVIPPDSRLVRLRSIEDQQPLTLRRVDEE
jgi:hypothetical protein